jgi:hypothetical protein
VHAECARPVVFALHSTPPGRISQSREPSFHR